MNDLIIFGSGGHSKVIASEFQRNSSPIKYFVSDFEDSENIISQELLLRLYNDKEFDGLIAIGDNNVRKSVFISFSQLLPRINWVNCISRASYICPNTELGNGLSIIGQTTINTGSRISDHVIINTNTVIDHDCSIGEFVNISPGSIINGNVKIESGTFIGSGTVVKQGIRIGKNVLIGSNSNVLKDVPNNVYGYGNPFKVIGKREDGELFTI